MSDINTRHYNDEDREQHTERVVTIEDATGEEYEHVFEATDEGHEYQGDGDPPDSALEAIEEFEAAQEESEETAEEDA
jgi:hypothetical protein